MPYRVGIINAERTAITVETKVIHQTTEFNRPIRPIFYPLKVK
jgi:hypothetical protein